jgi:hypothetical protein
MKHSVSTEMHLHFQGTHWVVTDLSHTAFSCGFTQNSEENMYFHGVKDKNPVKSAI